MRKNFEEARFFVRGLNLKTQKEWLSYCKNKKTSNDIPVNPNIAYKNKGWINWGDFLGSGSIANKNKKFKSFNEAKKFVKELGLKNKSDWDNFIRSKKKPSDIPFSPFIIYKDKGWKSWNDWFNEDDVDFLPFNEARKFVRELGLKNREQWWQYCKSGNKPNNIPANSNYYYRNKGWSGWGDWLGRCDIEFACFKDAKSAIKELNIKTYRDWINYCKSGNKPKMIPYNPNRVYKNKGWTNWKDFLKQ